MVFAELGALYFASHERYVPLTRAHNAELLHALHTLSQVVAVGFVAAVGLAMWRALVGRAELDPALSAHRPQVIACHAGAFLLLLGLYQVLPHWREIGLLLGVRELTVFALMIGAILLFTSTACALALPASFRRYWKRPASLATLLAVAVTATILIRSDWLTLAALRHPIENATLTLSVALYGAFDLPPAEVLRWGADPVLMAEDFAIRIAPVCSGYQGLFACAALLGGYVMLERQCLHLRSALLATLFALGVMFTLNAARIAILFAIGVMGRPEVALNGFHSHFGVLALLVVVGLAIVALETSVFRRAVATPHPGETRSAGGETIGLLLLPLAGLLAAGLITGLFQGEMDWLYPVPVLIGAVLVWAHRDMLIARLTPGPSPAGIVCGVAVFAMWISVVPPNETRSAEMVAALGAVPLPLALGWVAWRILGGSLVVPIVEELAFRGGALHVARRILPRGWSAQARIGLALGGSSVAFGVLHAHMLAGILAGLIYGSLAFWRGGLSDAIVAHVVTNALLAITVLGFGHWSYW